MSKPKLENRSGNVVAWLIPLAVVVVAIAAVIGLTVGIKACAGSNDYSKWNNGVCTECGGEYEFTSATAVRGWGSEYYYTCEDCGHTIKTQRIMK